jgi:hypothetical protein
MFPQIRNYKVKAHFVTLLAVWWFCVDLIAVPVLVLPVEEQGLIIGAYAAFVLHGLIVSLALFFWITERPKRKATTSGLYRNPKKLF